MGSIVYLWSLWSENPTIEPDMTPEIRNTDSESMASEHQLSRVPRCGVESLINLQPCRLNDPSGTQPLVLGNSDEGQVCGTGGVQEGWYYATVVLITAILATILIVGVVFLSERRKRRWAAMGH